MRIQARRDEDSSICPLILVSHESALHIRSQQIFGRKKDESP
jgi:hypothetical protein